MWLFFKNGIKQLFKEKIQFIIYIILVALAIIFSSVFGIAASSLTKTSDSLANEFQNYDYSYKYTSSNYSSNDTATISPWFAFDAELVSKDVNPDDESNGINSFPTLTIGDDGVLKAYEFNWGGGFRKLAYDDSLYHGTSISAGTNDTILNKNQLWLNFHFGDVESAVNGGDSAIKGPKHPYNEYTTSEKYELVRTGEFGSFYRFNLQNEAFKKSLIGQMYKKFNFVNTKFSDASVQSVKAATNIFDYMLYLNNSTLTDTIKVNIMSKFLSIAGSNGDNHEEVSRNVNEYVNGDGKHKSEINNISEVSGNEEGSSLNGRIGWLLKDGNATAYSLGLDNKQINYIFPKEDKKDEGFTDNQNEILNYGSLFVKNYESFDVLTNCANGNEYQYNHQNFSNRFFFLAYNDMISDLTNFESISASQTVMWDVGTKFRFISAFYDSTDENGNDVSHWYNEDLIKVYNQNNSGNANFLRGTFGVSAGYANSKNMSLGNVYKIIPGLYNKSFRYDGQIVDSLNTYPAIYDEDILTDKDTQAIFYLDNSDYRLLFGDGGLASTDSGEDMDITRSNDNYQDVSRTYLNYTLKDKTNMEFDHSVYQLYLANNLVEMDKVLDGMTGFAASSNPSDANTYEGESGKFLSSNFSSSNLQTYSETGTINLRSNLLPMVSKMFMVISIVLSGIFIAVIIFVVYNILKRFLNQQRGQLGNLKSLGVRKTKLITNFVSYMIVPVFILVPISWVISIGIEVPIMNILNSYFNIPATILVDWQFLLIEWVIALILIGGLVWFVSWKVIKKSPLDLLNPSSDMKRVPLISKWLSKINFKHFTSRMRATIVSTSLKNIATYISVFFIASSILTVSLLIPGTLTNMTTEYYANVKYENRFSYNGTLSNVPYTQNSFYKITDHDEVARSNDEAMASSLNIYKGDASPLFNDNGYWTKDNIGSYIDLFFPTLLAMNGSQFSVDTMDRLVKNEQEIIGSSEGVTGNIEDTLNTFTCSFVPKMFGQKAIDPLTTPEGEKPYSYCVKQVANNVIPSSIKEMWSNDENEFKLFSLDFGKMSFDKTQDQLLTEFSGYVGDDVRNQLETYVYGIDNQSKNQELKLNNIDNFLDDKNNTTDIIPVTINKKMILKKYKTGDVIPIYVNDNKMYNGDVEDNNPLTNDEWYYVNGDIDNYDYSDLTDEDLISEQNIDFSKMSYSDQDVEYYGNDGTLHPYYKPQNIILKIAGDTKNIDKVNDAYVKLTGHKAPEKNADGNYYINPYDVRHFEDGKPEDIGLEALASGKFSYSWWSIATNGVNIPEETDDNGKITSEAIIAPSILHTNNKVVKSDLKLKVVGVQNNLYDGYSIYMSQNNANRLLGFSNPGKTVSLDGENINAWSNAKMSYDQDISDQFRRMTLHAKNGDTSINGLGNGGAIQSITNGTYIGKTKEVIDKLIVSVYAICIIFIAIAVIASLVLIFLITDLTVGRFKIFMGFMRVQGYKMSEINSIIMWIFAPIAVISIILGELLVYLLIDYLVPNILLSVNIAVPLNLSMTMMIVTFFIGIAIFAAAYVYIITSIKKIKLTLLTSQM
jgi:putative ABC transport system permease protein